MKGGEAVVKVHHNHDAAASWRMWDVDGTLARVISNQDREHGVGSEGGKLAWGNRWTVWLLRGYEV